jgi:hypothetical protein
LTAAVRCLPLCSATDGQQLWGESFLLERGTVTPQELELFHERRSSLFSSQIPIHVIASISYDCASLDYERSILALIRYREERPYKGFFLDRFKHHYRSTATDGRTDGRTDGQPLRAAAAAAAAAALHPDELERERDLVFEEKQREVEAYRAIPADRLKEAFRELKHLNLPMRETSRDWRLAVVDWYQGKDVSMYQLHSSPFGSEARRVPQMAESHVLIMELRNRISELEVACQSTPVLKA